MEPVRLNKYLSDKGICSRREADRLVEAGSVSVNGKKAEMGQKVTEKDEILVDGIKVGEKAPKKVIIAVNKPVGVVCTTRTFKGETNIVELVDYEDRLYPVGRLDKDSEGLIFLTNDGGFMERVTNAAGRHEKDYEVPVHKDLTDHFVERMEKGVYLEDLNRQTAACRLTKIGDKKFRIVLTQGLNRQIRRMCDTLGYRVVSLKRVRIMNVKLGDLKVGEWREIEGEEKRELLTLSEKKKKPVSGKSTPKKPEKKK